MSRFAPIGIAIACWLGWPTAGPATAAEAAPGTVVQDAYYGEALFHFYREDHFAALVHLLVARDAGRLTHHAEEAELLLGGLYLHYGQHDRAESIFTRLLDASTAPRVRDRAWFYVGKVRYQRGLFDAALAAFAQVGTQLPADLAAELPMLRAQSHLAAGRVEPAIAALDGWNGAADWLPFARYNLGVALLRAGRFAQGAAQLDAVGQSPAQGAEQLGLRDQANLALGYAYLQGGLDDAAAPVLARVRLDGPFSNKALLGAGWASAARADYQAALTPWLALRDRDLLDSAVQESLLAIPYAYAQLDAHGTAVQEYESALAMFDVEIGRLDLAIQRAREGGLVPAILRADDAGIGRWHWELEQLPDTLEARYLYHLLADHEMQEGLRNVRDLMALDAQLTDWAERLGAFRDMVDTRAQAFAALAPAAGSRLDAVDLAPLRARRNSLAARLAEAAERRDPVALATAAELDQWRRLGAIEASPALAAPQAADARERQRILRGVLAWQLDREFKYRLWQQRRALASLDAELERAAGGRERGRQARGGVPAELDSFAARIRDLAPRIGALRARLAAQRSREEAILQARAVESLEAQRARLSAYRVEAQFALATVYDRAAARTAQTGEAPQ